jgi:hypothetical protein
MASRERSDGSQFAAIMDTDDVLVLQARGQVRVTIETPAKFQILGQIAGQDFQRRGGAAADAGPDRRDPSRRPPAVERWCIRRTPALPPDLRCCHRFATCEHATEAATGSDRIIAAWLISEPDEIGG